MGARPGTLVTILGRVFGRPKMKSMPRVNMINAYELSAGETGDFPPRRQAVRGILANGEDIATAIVMRARPAGGVFGETLDRLQSRGRDPSKPPLASSFGGSPVFNANSQPRL